MLSAANVWICWAVFFFLISVPVNRCSLVELESYGEKSLCVAWALLVTLSRIFIALATSVSIGIFSALVISWSMSFLVCVIGLNLFF